MRAPFDYLLTCIAKDTSVFRWTRRKRRCGRRNTGARSFTDYGSSVGVKKEHEKPSPSQSAATGKLRRFSCQVNSRRPLTQIPHLQQVRYHSFELWISTTR